MRAFGYEAQIVHMQTALPGNLRPHVIADKHIEHFAAYFITGGLSALTYARPRQLVISCALLTACAAVLALLESGKFIRMCQVS